MKPIRQAERARRLYEAKKSEYGEAVARCTYKAYVADESYIKNAWAAMGTHYLTETLGFSEQTLVEFRNQVLEG